LHFGIVGCALLGHLEIAIGLVHLLQLLIRKRQQQFGSRVGLRMLGPAKPVNRIAIVPRAHVQVAQHHRVVGPLRVCGQHLLQQTLGVGGSPHHTLRLRKAGDSIQRRRCDAKTFCVCVHRELILAVETRHIPVEEPQLRIVGRGLRGALRVIERQCAIAVCERRLGGARQSGVLDIRSPAERLIGGPALIFALLRLRLIRSGGINLVNLRIGSARKCSRCEDQPNPQYSKSCDQVESPGRESTGPEIES